MTDGPSVRATAIPGLLVVDLPVHADARGWFKENWQRARMVELGLPDFGPVQQNVAYNAEAGVTRGLHAEPWDKLVSVGCGRVFGAWVDLRPGAGFGRAVTLELGPETAVFVPRGVANGYQTLVDGTAYSYLVNAHWTPETRASTSYLNLADETLGIAWPIPLADAVISEADAAHPHLADVRPMPPKQTVIIGRGQLGRALVDVLPDARCLGRAAGDRRRELRHRTIPEPVEGSSDFDLTRPDLAAALDWSQVGAIINAAAYTDVEAAETAEGRREAWAVNVDGVARLCRIAAERGITLVHLSTDYVFDGTVTEHHENEPATPLGVYGQTKAAGDALVGQLARHYLVRTSWLVGEGRNFVRTMAERSAAGDRVEVVSDQDGRLTFAEDLAAGIVHLLTTGAPFGTYNLSNAGPVQSWAEIAADVFELCGRPRQDVIPVTTAQYAAGKPAAPRPPHSALKLDKLIATGFTPPPAADRLATYLADLR